MLHVLVLITCILCALAAPEKHRPELPRSPDPSRCAHRKIHETFNGHGYMFTWEEPKTAGLELAWAEAREFCRTRCMDLVSLENQEENQFIKERLAKGNQPYMWTSGRKCNFKGCERADLQPVNVYGWFWTGSLERMPATTNRLDSDWSDTGGFGRPQPDDREHYQGGPEEECLAILNNLFDDGIRWHDVACKHRKPFVCEDSDDLLQILQRSVNDTDVAVAKLAVFDDLSSKLLPPFPSSSQKKQPGLRSAQGSLVLANSEAVVDAVTHTLEIDTDPVPLVPVVPATYHTVMLLEEMPPISLVPEESKTIDLSSEDKTGIVSDKSV